MPNERRPSLAAGSSQERDVPTGSVPTVKDSIPTYVDLSTESRDWNTITPRFRTVPDEQRAGESQPDKQYPQIRADHRDGDYPNRADHAASAHVDSSPGKSRDVRPLIPIAGPKTSTRSRLEMIELGIVDSVTFIAFMAAISLPFLYLPLLIFGGVDAARSTPFFLLLSLHAVSLIIGYRYEPQKSLGGD